MTLRQAQGKRKIPVGILGATGMVGQRFITLLKDHPWFEVVCVAASPRSAGLKYKDAVKDKWMMDQPIPKIVANLTVLAVEKDLKKIVKQVSFVFCALDLEKEKIKEIENAYAVSDIPVISNNSANRWTKDVPVLLPEINPQHLKLIDVQKKKRGYNRGFIVVKPNCSIQSYVPLLTPLWDFGIKEVMVTTFQAVSGASKTLKTWKEMNDNVIPYIDGEEQKSEKEPLKVWGTLKGDFINIAKTPRISVTCVRVPVNDGHLAVVRVNFKKKPTKDGIIKIWKSYKSPIASLNLPSSPNPFITVFDQDDRPQTYLDRMVGNGMGISVGRLKEDNLFDYSFVGLSHNTIRGAAGGAIITAELLKVKGYLDGKIK